ncbi:O52K1 protein, partial [Atractosteus spatula]|nr:O52K1 protein [Atractosteus spatula]
MQRYQGGNISHSEFFLIGFSGLKEHRWLLFFPFFLMFALSVVANALLIFVVKTQRSLHSPMCVLIGATSVINLFLTMSFMPRMLLSFLFNWNGISLLGCLVQMFFINFIGTFQSSILLLMAIDRYVAICIPLRYNDYLNTPNCFKFVIASLLRSTIFFVVVAFLDGSLSYCNSNIIDHCFCEHMALVGLACGSTLINNIFGLLIIFLITVFDWVCVFISYVKIFISVFFKASGKSSRKAIHTCTTHIIVLFLNYIYVMIALLSYRIGNSLSPNIRVLISIMYLLFPSCFHPIIYGFKTKDIREQILKALKSVRNNQVSVKMTDVMYNQPK